MIKGAAQFVRSEVDSRGYDVFPEMNLPGTYSLDLTGDFPQVAFTSPSSVEDPVNTRWFAHMPNRQFNKGEMDAFNLDAEFSISDDGFFRSVRAGVRHADRKENDNGYYGWTNLCAGWDGCDQSTRTFDQAQDGDVQFQAFPDFFRGDANLPSGIWMPSFARVGQLDPDAVDAEYGINTADTNALAHNNFDFVPTDSREQEILNKAAYVMLRFAAFDRRRTADRWQSRCAGGQNREHQQRVLRSAKACSPNRSRRRPDQLSREHSQSVRRLFDPICGHDGHPRLALDQPALQAQRFRADPACLRRDHGPGAI